LLAKAGAIASERIAIKTNIFFIVLVLRIIPNVSDLARGFLK